MWWRHRLAACATLLLAWHASGVAQQYGFRHYGSAEGLQNLTILSLAQDGAGYIWAGSEGGLYRYDGTRFRLMGGAEGCRAARKSMPCTWRRMARSGPIPARAFSVSTGGVSTPSPG